MQVEPQTPLPVVYQIVDHTDPSKDSYYVRAVVRDSLTGQTLKVINVPAVGGGSGRYATSTPAPQDGTGLGRQIDITTVPYIDSDYTTKADNYQQVIEKWYVKAAPISFGYGGGPDGASEVDYKLIRRIFAEELVNAINEMEKPEAVEMEPVMEALNLIAKGVSGIKMPEIPGVDLAPVLEQIQATEMAVISAIDDIPAPEETDLTPVMSRMNEVHDSLANKVETEAENHRQELPLTVSKRVDESLSKALAESKAQRDKTNQALRLMLTDNEPGLTPPSKKDSVFSRFMQKP